VANDYDAKAAIKARDDFKRQNGKDDPNLVSRAASECAKLKNEFSANNVNQPLWLKNERG